jgi:choline dehydrogenase-like flavoprotein
MSLTHWTAGTSGLRVVDASVIPVVPTAHTQGTLFRQRPYSCDDNRLSGPVYLIAERAAVLILAAAAAAGK